MDRSFRSFSNLVAICHRTVSCCEICHGQRIENRRKTYTNIASSVEKKEGILGSGHWQSKAVIKGQCLPLSLKEHLKGMSFPSRSRGSRYCCQLAMPHKQNHCSSGYTLQ